MPFNAAKTLLLEIDVQNDFCPAYISCKDLTDANTIATN